MLDWPRLYYRIHFYKNMYAKFSLGLMEQNYHKKTGKVGEIYG